MKTNVVITLLVIAAGVSVFVLRERAAREEHLVAAALAQHAAERAQLNSNQRKIDIDWAEKSFVTGCESAEIARKYEASTGNAQLANIHFETTKTNLILERSAAIQRAKDEYPEGQ